MKKVPENIEAFQEMVGFVLARLYEIHPEELQAEVVDFFGNRVPSDKEATLFENTVKYLVRHGYLHQDKQYFLQLTPSSWEVLRQPNPMNKAETLGASLVSWMKEASSDTTKGLLSQGAGLVLTMVYEAIASV